MRVHHVNKARKDAGPCRKCASKIKKGQSYKYIRPRKMGKVKFCHKCPVRSSDMARGRNAEVYAAQEAAEDALGTWSGTDTSGLEEIANELASQVRDIAEDYRASAESILEHFSSSPTADDCEDKASELDGWADELESLSFDEWSPEEEEEGEDEPRNSDGQTEEEWADAQRDVLADALGNCPI